MNLNDENANTINNPYLIGAAGKKEWNDRYMVMSDAIKNWQRVAFISLILVVLFSVLIIKLALSTKIQPFVVETHDGVPYAMKPMKAISEQDQRLIGFALNQFIINSRSILGDFDAEKIILNKVYAFSSGSTLQFLHDFYQKHDPFLQAKKETVSINIINTLPVSKNTWQITWDEVKHSSDSGQLIETSRWMAQLTYQLGEVNPKFINDNPFGIYISRVTWSQSKL